MSAMTLDDDPMRRPASLDIDLFSDDALADPYPLYAQIRDAGPIVWLEGLQVWVTGRYDEVRRILTEDRRFVSGQGVGLTPEANHAMRGAVLASDPPVHQILRGVLNERLSRRGIAELANHINAAADVHIEALVEKRAFDGAADLAKAFPLKVVADLIGLPEDVRPKLLRWADAMFNTFGPPNARTMESLPILFDMGQYLGSVTLDQLTPGSLGAAVFEAGERGVLRPEQCASLLGAYLGAGLDTTIHSISAAVLLFGQHPDQWDLVRANPELAAQAYDEVLRLQTPVLGFTRVAVEDAAFGDDVVKAGQRVMVLYASANRDPRKWDEPERFDVLRKPVDHLAFGVGRHFCAGQSLAKLEGEALIRAMAQRVARFELGEPRYQLNNALRGLASLPARVVPA